MEYITSAVNVVSFNPCVDPSPRIKISFLFCEYAHMNSNQLQK